MRHQNERPRCGLGKAEAVDHFRRGHPVMRLDRLLRHVGQQRIGAAERHHRQLGEEHADADQHVVRAERYRGQRDRRPPDRQSNHRRHQKLPPAGFVRRCGGLGLSGKPKPRGRGSRDEVADQTRAGDDQRKRQRQKENADEGEQRQADERRGFQAAPRDADQGLDHDDQHGRLDAEQRAVNRRHALAQRVEQAEAQHHERARQHEQNAGGKPAAHAVQQPADIDRKLGRFRPRQQHAEIERVQEARLVDPLLFVDQDAMHHGDLAGRPAEIDAADLQPDLEGFAEARL